MSVREMNYKERDQFFGEHMNMLGLSLKPACQIQIKSAGLQPGDLAAENITVKKVSVSKLKEATYFATPSNNWRPIVEQTKYLKTEGDHAEYSVGPTNPAATELAQDLKLISSSYGVDFDFHHADDTKV